MNVEWARLECHYLAEVAEFWGSRGHDCQRDLGFVCSPCHQFYGDCEAASIAYDLAVSEDVARRSVAY